MAENISLAYLISIPPGFEKIETEVHSDDAAPSIDDRQNYPRKAGKVLRECMYEKGK